MSTLKDSVMANTIAKWRNCWQVGFAPQFCNDQLQSLAEALQRNDARLIQGATTAPPPMQAVQDWPCEATDAIAWTAWMGGDGDYQNVGKWKNSLPDSVSRRTRPSGNPPGAGTS